MRAHREFLLFAAVATWVACGPAQRAREPQNVSSERALEPTGDAPPRPSEHECPERYEWTCHAAEPNEKCVWMCKRLHGGKDFGIDPVPPRPPAQTGCVHNLRWTEPPPMPNTGCPGCEVYKSWDELRRSFKPELRWFCDQCGADSDCPANAQFCRRYLCTPNPCPPGARFVPPGNCEMLPPGPTPP